MLEIKISSVENTSRETPVVNDKLLIVQSYALVKILAFNGLHQYKWKKQLVSAQLLTLCESTGSNFKAEIEDFEVAGQCG